MVDERKKTKMMTKGLALENDEIVTYNAVHVTLHTWHITAAYSD